MYGVLPYYFAKSVIDVPLSALTPVFTSIILYFGIGTDIQVDKFFTYYLALFFLNQCGVAIGYMLSAVFSKEETAVNLSPTIVMPIILFGGFFANGGGYPSWISWF